MKLYHGTSADNLASIMAHGLNPNHDAKLWLPSLNETYCWSAEHIARYEDMDSESAEYDAKRRAIESGQFSLACAKDCRIVLIELDLPEDMFKEDTSCRNMQGAVCTTQAIPASQFTSIQVSNDLSLLRGLFISYAVNNDLSNLLFSEIEHKIAAAFSKMEFYPEDLEELIQFSEV